MQRRLVLTLIILLALGLGACGDETPGPSDGGDETSDAASGLDSAATGDASAPDRTEPGDAFDPQDASQGADAEPTPDTGATFDSGADAGLPTLGPVQCRATADCGGLECSRNAPGGICLGCGSPSDCPSSDFDCVVGACVRECSGDPDCSLGMRCNPNGLCVVRSCSAEAACPAPYECSGQLCTRPACGVGDTCPEPLQCQSGVCVEP